MDAPTPEERADAILAEWLDQRGEGRAPAPRQLMQDHPELAEILQQRFDALAVLDTLFSEQDAAADVPESVGGYRIICEIGRGAMGIVYEAEQPALERRVALKMLAPSISGNAELVARFYREAQAAGRLDHPNIVAVHEIGREGRTLFYTMELVEGRSLADAIDAARGKIPEDPAQYLERVVAIGAQIADGLQAAHDEGVIHRDIKPSNILLSDAGVPKLVDFGLARFASGTDTLTEPGVILGTLQYMSPEQAMARRDELDARTDVYSLGATLYEALSLHSPFSGSDPVELLSQIILNEPPPLRKLDPGIPKHLETIVMQAMAKDRDRRYGAARDLADDLRRFAASLKIRAKRPGLVDRAAAWARRHRHQALAAAVLVSVVLTGGLGSALRPGTGAGRTLAMPTATDIGFGDYAQRAGLDADGAAAWMDAKVLDWCNFVIPGAGLGTALSLRGLAGEFDLRAFDAKGQFLWSLQEEWGGYSRYLNDGQLRHRALHSLITARHGPVLEESICFVIGARGDSVVLVLDPQTGVPRYVSLVPLVHTPSARGMSSLCTLPTSADGRRSILIAGRSGGKINGRATIACIAPGGHVAQVLRFPMLKTLAPREVEANNIRTDWSPDRAEVTFDTSEAIHFSYLVRDGRLVTHEPLGMLSDSVWYQYDAARSDGAFEQLLADAGGYSAFTQQLAAQVEVRE